MNFAPHFLIIPIFTVLKASGESRFFELGKVYTFNVTGNALPGPLKNLQTVYDLQLTGISSNTVGFKSSHLQILETSSPISIEHWNEIQYYFEAPMQVTFDPWGQILSIKVPPNLPQWALDIKKVQISRFILSISDSNQYTLQERSYLGTCEAMYSAHEIPLPNNPWNPEQELYRFCYANSKAYEISKTVNTEHCQNKVSNNLQNVMDSTQYLTCGFSRQNVKILRIFHISQSETTRTVQFVLTNVDNVYGNQTQLASTDFVEIFDLVQNQNTEGGYQTPNLNQSYGQMPVPSTCPVGSTPTNRTMQTYTEAEKEAIWKRQLPCYMKKERVDLRTIRGLYYVPFVYAPPYWSTFGKDLCKWVKAIPESENTLNYFGGYFTTTGEKLYKYTGLLKYNMEDGVYNAEERFITRGTTSIFSTTPCIVSADTFMFYIPSPSNGTCISQTFVFSRNTETAFRDEKMIKEVCYRRYNIPPQEIPYYASGCADAGLF